jgi:hypothetical protein
MANFSSFSPKNLSGAVKYYADIIELVAGDSTPELNITLRDSKTAATGKTLDASDPDTWAILDLSAVSAVRMYFRKTNETTIIATITCSIVTPATSGVVLMAWPATTLAGLEGTYEGEIEITYASGKISTVQDLLRFNIRSGF